MRYTDLMYFLIWWTQKCTSFLRYSCQKCLPQSNHEKTSDQLKWRAILHKPGQPSKEWGCSNVLQWTNALNKSGDIVQEHTVRKTNKQLINQTTWMDSCGIFCWVKKKSSFERSHSIRVHLYGILEWQNYIQRTESCLLGLGKGREQRQPSLGTIRDPYDWTVFDGGHKKPPMIKLNRIKHACIYRHRDIHKPM